MTRAPTLRRILLCSLAALSLGLGGVSLIAGFSDSLPIRLVQGVAVFGAGVAVLGAATVLALVRVAGWRDPESEEEFEALVQRTERLASGQEAWLPDDDPLERLGRELQAPDPDVESFAALVRGAIDELPLEFHIALEHVAVVIGDDGRRYGAYGLYQGDTVAQDHFHERIVIFRDTLMRDFGHDPDLLARQVRRTLRHELGHHLGWDEKGVRGLGL